MPSFCRDATIFQIRYIFFTDRGNFWGPIIHVCTPKEEIACNYREHQTHPVKFEKRFCLLNVLAVDLENEQLVRPEGTTFPEEIGVGETVAFQFRFKQCLR